MEGDQYRDGCAQYEPAVVWHQRGNSLWIHYNGEIRKAAVCKTKIYKLVRGSKKIWRMKVD